MSGRPASVDTDTRRRSKADLGLVKAGPGAPRLLSALVRRGLAEEHLLAAAMIAVLLEEAASP